MKKIFIITIASFFVLVVAIVILGIYRFNFTNDDMYLSSGEKIDSRGTAYLADSQETSLPNSQDLSIKNTESLETSTTVQLVNPASTNCLKLGGKLVIEKRGDGGEFGLCYFEENRACEEWALLRGDCPVGGRKTTGYDTIDQNYCVWLGGETFAVPNSVCTFQNGSRCPTIDFYNGKCLMKE